MKKVTYKVEVEKGYEFSTKVIVDFLLKTNCLSTGKDQIIVTLDDANSKRSINNKRMLKQLSHVNSVKA